MTLMLISEGTSSGHCETLRKFVNNSCVGSYLDEVVVEKAVEDGVGAGGGDTQHVTEQEGDHHRLYTITIFSFLFQFNEDQCKTSIVSC